MENFGLVASVLSETQELAKVSKIANALVWKKLTVVWYESFTIDIVLFYQFSFFGF